jgi:glycine/D-amino acid oxidase-like deaminating enzyme
MAQSSADIVIVGGGIAGMTTAYYLAKAGVPSVVVERDAIGSHASGFAYGGLSPLSGFGIPGPGPIYTPFHEKRNEANRPDVRAVSG